MAGRAKKPAGADQPPTRSAAGRAFRMTAMGMGVAGSYVGYLMQRAFLGKDRRKRRLSAAHAKAARRMTREMTALRGPAMKLGQTLSLHAGILPDETIAELTSLQREAPGMHPSLVRAQFKSSMGRLPEDLFASFDDVPFAAASLGQVHRATLRDGTEVAVKIQYPGIGDAVANDFAWFRAVSKPAQATGHLPAGAIDELERQIVAETDYAREADNLEYFHNGLAPLRYAAVPRLFREQSSSRVLTMTLLSGQHLDDFLASKPSQAIRDRAGEHLLDLFNFQLMELHALHADPHWGNYLFRDDGGIGLVDYGCVKYLTRPFVEDLRGIMLYPGSRNSDRFRELLDQRYRTMGGRITPAARRTLVRFAEDFYQRVFPWQPERDDELFDFGSAEFLREYLRGSQELFRAKGTLPEYIFLARAEIGLYQTLHRLRARVATSRIVRRYLKRKS